jgi:hypothetical protein
LNSVLSPARSTGRAPEDKSRHRQPVWGNAALAWASGREEGPCLRTQSVSKKSWRTAFPLQALDPLESEEKNSSPQSSVRICV